MLLNLRRLGIFNESPMVFLSKFVIMINPVMQSPRAIARVPEEAGMCNLLYQGMPHQGPWLQTKGWWWEQGEWSLLTSSIISCCHPELSSCSQSKLHQLAHQIPTTSWRSWAQTVHNNLPCSSSISASITKCLVSWNFKVSQWFQEAH